MCYCFFFSASMTRLAYIFYVFHDNANIELLTMRCHLLLLSCRINVPYFIIAWIKILIFTYVEGNCLVEFWHIAMNMSCGGTRFNQKPKLSVYRAFVPRTSAQEGHCVNALSMIGRRE